MLPQIPEVCSDKSHQLPLLLVGFPGTIGKMRNSPLDKLIVGVLLTLVGLAIILFHRSFKQSYDWWQSRDWPVGLGNAWTGKYSRGGLIFIYVVIILIGALFLGTGISQIVAAIHP
jgi:hypothetical protein